MNLKGLLSTISRSWLAAIAMAAGVLVLAGYFFPSPTLVGLRSFLLNVAVIMTGFAVFVGVANLLNVHSKKIRRKGKGSGYSTLLIVFLVVTFLIGFAAHFLPAVEPLFSWAFNYIQVPVEASLMGILAVTLLYAAIRLLRRRLDFLSILFLITALVVLFGTASLPFIGEVPGLSTLVRQFVSPVLATAGARGILLGVALGIVVMGLRVLFGTDRPYGGK